MDEKKVLHIRVQPQFHAALKEAADQEGRSVSNLVVKVITDYLEAQERADGGADER